MHRGWICLLLLLVVVVEDRGRADDWRQWRGPTGNNYAASTNPPLKWDRTTNVVWKSPIPGRGHSSPIVVGNRIFLTTADETQQTQSVLAFDRRAGRKLWEQVIHKGNLVKKIHQKNTHASPTAAADDQALFVFFNNGDSVFLTKLTHEGKQLWQKKAGQFVPYYPFGFAASPTLWKNLVIVTAESEKYGFLCAYDRETGDEVWRTARDATSYSSPIVASWPNNPQILLSGGSAVSGFDPASGKRLWSAPANWEVSCGTLVWDDQRVFASGGYPRAQTLCVKADGSGEIVWENRVKCYEQSLLYHDGYVYGISDPGIGYCWRATDGEEMWKARMDGPVSSSPILANGNIYYSSERGKTFVFRANPQKFELLAENQLGDSAFATPVFCDDQILMRVAFDENGVRQEYLYCIGKQP